VSKKTAIAKQEFDAVRLAGDLGPLLTVQEVAAVLRCSVSTLNKWRLIGRGPSFVRVGARVRYRPTDIAVYVAAQTFNSTLELPAA
jgi:excisionase family DNA binding protein